jgi:hypothetical protein
MVEAGFIGTSARWLMTTDPDSTGSTTMPAASNGTRARASAAATGSGMFAAKA